MNFKYYVMRDDVIREHIRNCEGRHVQQTAFSTFMDCLTQICFTEQVIRSSIAWEGNRSWKVDPTLNTGVTPSHLQGTTGGGR